MLTIDYLPIGVIHSPFKSPDSAPLQPNQARGAKGRIELEAMYEEGLSDLRTFSHIILIYHFHLTRGYSLKIKTPHDATTRGVFATRTSARPNPIGLSIVRLESIDRSTVHISDVDVVDGTPLLDIKPFVPSLARQRGAKMGWLMDVLYDV